MMAEELENFGDEMILENNEFIRIQLLRRKVNDIIIIVFTKIMNLISSI